MNIEVPVVDYFNEQHSIDVIYFLKNYAIDLMGGGAPQSSFDTENLVSKLSKLPYTISVICYVDGKPAG